MIIDPRKAFSKALVEIGTIHPEVLAVSCDSASGSGMNEFIRLYPDRYVETGICESAAIDIAAGLAINGFIPVISAIAPFISMRSFEQVRNDCGYANQNVKIIGSSSGLSHSTAGSSHQAIEDMALMRTVPNMLILNPGDCFEVEMSLKKAVEHIGPVYIRMPRHNLKDIAPIEGRTFELKNAEVLSEGDVMMIASGTTVNEAIMAAEMLANDGISAGVINMHTVKPIDSEIVLKYAKTARLMLTVEEHSVIGGLGGAVAECLAPVAGTAPLYIFGIEDGAKNTGPYYELLTYYELSGERIYKRVLDLLD